MPTYEAMFLVDPTFAENWNECEGRIRNVLDRAGVSDVLRVKKWDDRRLCYEIEGRRRAAYVLCYFRGPTGAPSHIERDVQLSEDLLRVLVLRADHVDRKPELLDADTPLTAPRRNDDDFEFGGGGPRRDDRRRGGGGGGGGRGRGAPNAGGPAAAPVSGD